MTRRRKLFSWRETEHLALMLAGEAQKKGWTDAKVRKASETCWQVFAIPPQRTRRPYRP